MTKAMMELVVGRGMDGLVAKRVMGYTNVRFEAGNPTWSELALLGDAPGDYRAAWPLVPKFSTRLKSAWRVIERMLNDPDENIRLQFIGAVALHGGLVVPYHIAAERICRAALDVLGGMD